MRALNSAVFAFGILAFSIIAADAEATYSSEDSAFKQANLASLTPYEPADAERKPVWSKLITMAAKYQDYEIANRMFDLRRKAGGDEATAYALDLLRLYQADAAFFVEAANTYFKGDYSFIFAFWFDGNGTVSLMDLQGPAKRAAGNELVRQFMKAADSADQKMMSMY